LMTRGDWEASVERVIDPDEDEADDGVNVALKVLLRPAGITLDVLRPVNPKPAPLTEIWENVRGAVPAFLSAIVCELVSPTATVPKLTVEGVAEICAPPEILSVSVAFPVPLLFWAVRATVNVPEVVGVPEMRPLAGLTLSPSGNPDAPKLNGEFVAVI